MTVRYPIYFIVGKCHLMVTIIDIRGEPPYVEILDVWDSWDGVPGLSERDGHDGEKGEKGDKGDIGPGGPKSGWRCGL